MTKKKSNKKWLIIGLIVVVIIIVGLAIKKGQGEKATRVAVEKVELRTITETVSANGKIQPEKEVKITPYISGEVVELNVKEGDLVEEGKLLARIDPEIYRSNYEKMEASLQSQRASLANAKARLAQTKAQFTNAKLSFERNKKLWKK